MEATAVGVLNGSIKLGRVLGKQKFYTRDATTKQIVGGLQNAPLSCHGEATTTDQGGGAC
jgi:hypothetical protein